MATTTPMTAFEGPGIFQHLRMSKRDEAQWVVAPKCKFWACTLAVLALANSPAVAQQLGSWRKRRGSWMFMLIVLLHRDFNGLPYIYKFFIPCPTGKHVS